MKRNEVVAVLKEVRDSFESQMKPLMERKALKKKQMDDMMAGCADGARTCISILQEKGFLIVED